MLILLVHSVVEDTLGSTIYSCLIEVEPGDSPKVAEAQRIPLQPTPCLICVNQRNLSRRAVDLRR